MLTDLKSVVEGVIVGNVERNRDDSDSSSNSSSSNSTSSSSLASTSVRVGSGSISTMVLDWSEEVDSEKNNYKLLEDFNFDLIIASDTCWLKSQVIDFVKVVKRLLSSASPSSSSRLIDSTKKP